MQTSVDRMNAVSNIQGVVIICCVIISVLAFILYRLRSLINQTKKYRKQIIESAKTNEGDDEVLKDGFKLKHTDSLLFVLGSGGHTAEMLSLLTTLQPHLEESTKLVFVSTKTDSHSLSKTKDWVEASNLCNDCKYEVVPRAREVGESIISSCISTLKTLFSTVRVLITYNPGILLVNGPATAAVFGMVSFGGRVLGLSRTRIVYIESFARVSSLSLSGRICYSFADRFVVQWPQLAEQWELAEYYGRVC